MFEMPTIIAFDCSLSMSRFISTKSRSENEVKVSLKTMAHNAVRELINYLESRVKLEYVALVGFAASTQVLCNFTRDHTALMTALENVKIQDKACLERLFNEVDALMSSEFGSIVPCDVIIVTDGRLNWETGFASTLSEECLKSWKFPERFKCNVHFLCLSNDLIKTKKEDFVKALIKVNKGRGSVNMLKDAEVDHKQAVKALVNDFTARYMEVFSGVLHCGKLKNEIVLFPSPASDSDDMMSDAPELNKDFQIVGFLNISDIKVPPACSRHLVLSQGNTFVSSKVEESTVDLGTVPSFIVTLHGSLKIDHKVALVQVGEDWYGMLSSFTDHKKKSNLMLSLFEVGSSCIPWLGNFSHLGPSEGAPHPIVDRKNSNAFVAPGDSKSYAQNIVVWTRPTGLQTDIQKLLRSAKRLPEKTTVFYKDLNRIRKAALAFGFHELLEGIASILERECTMLPGTSHPEATLQLSHAAQELKTVQGYDSMIAPLKTDFKYH